MVALFKGAIVIPYPVISAQYASAVTIALISVYIFPYLAFSKADRMIKSLRSSYTVR
ncbi:hypothetical protein [Nostoc sp. LEGE 12450]|uniref:hypothetical protein n=1 Tax=Nostoc sp. LEGE 12450 TaxID=1828643 RepID=UPI001880E167|nr:hypothetical protein [Nostoc sp. LEGE 12450]MBE8987586.1 hypothetical protein [Nostoc sp. LEGE 12450]